MESTHAPVLIVGAGLGGLSTAVFLGLHGVPAVVVDRHPGTARQPKARGQMPPIMEAFRAAGVADAMIDAAPPGTPEMTIVICESVTGSIMHSFAEAMPDFGAFSPAPAGMASQQSAEAALAARAVELGIDLRFSTRMESYEADDDGVRAVLRDLTTDTTYRLDAEYLVGADGNRGTIAATAGIGTHGRGAFGNTTTVLFAADLADRLPDSAILMYYAQNPALPDRAGAFVSTDVRGEYVAGVSPDPDRTDEQTIEVIRTLVGIPDLPVRLLGAGTWEIAHRVAETMSAGRVHLVGDAAHLMPPTGGQGGNTAMLDGLHLAWKLAASVTGQAGPGLLAGHSAEQLPYDTAIADWQYANMIERQHPELADGTEAAPIHPDAAMFGYQRATGAFVAEDGEAERFALPAVAAGRPGSRAPHVWLATGGNRVSTRDLFFRGFVLLTDDAPWIQAARTAAGRLGVELVAHHVGGELTDPEGAFGTAYGVKGGAVLVRPDGVVGWRTNGPADPAVLESALRVILDR